MLSADLAPGRLRRFAFMDWPDFDNGLFERVLEGSNQTVQAMAEDQKKKPAILGSDRDAGAIAMAEANAFGLELLRLSSFPARRSRRLNLPPLPVGW